MQPKPTAASQSVQDEEVERLMLEDGSVCVKVKKVAQQAFSVS